MEYNLDKLSKKVLKYIAKEHAINPMKHIELLKVKFGDDLDMSYLLECGYVTYYPYITVNNYKVNGDFYAISAKGWAYLQHYPIHRFQILYPIITSTISAITAIAAILISIFNP